MRDLGELPLEDAAKQAAGNWRQFSCFWWRRANDLEKPEDWAIRVHPQPGFWAAWTVSNASAIDECWHRLPRGAENSDPDVVEEESLPLGMGWIRRLFDPRLQARPDHQGVQGLPRTCPAHGRIPDP